MKKMKFILLLEIPSQVDQAQRIMIKKALKKVSYQEPKRNCFLLKVEKENKMKELKEWIVANSHVASKVNFYQIVDDEAVSN